jgi:hypothetical protein
MVELRRRDKFQELLLKHSILKQLEYYAPRSLSLSNIFQGIVIAGHQITLKELSEELHNLSKKSLIILNYQSISTDIPKYRLSALGKDYLEQQGLI